MPALLLHLSLAKQVLTSASARAPEPMARVAAANAGAVLLGSIFVDLPYYGRLFQQVLRQATRHDYLHAEWASLFHTVGTGQFAAAILARSSEGARGQSTGEALAFLLGHLCHYSADRVCHPAINQLVARLQRHDRRPPDILHTRIERYQSWFYHREVLGQKILAVRFNQEESRPRRQVCSPAKKSPPRA